MSALLNFPPDTTRQVAMPATGCGSTVSFQKRRVTVAGNAKRQPIATAKQR